MEYRRRIVDEQIDHMLSLFGAVLIKGPKWCGKTTSAEQHSRSSIYLQDPDESERYIQIADMKVSMLLEGENPRLIDEWQTIPKIWNAVRMSVDRKGETGLYILTGSVIPKLAIGLHSGAGRIATVSMRTMSLYESNESNGQVSLFNLFSGEPINGISDMGFERLAQILVRGGWPSCILHEIDGNEVVAEYCEAILNSEVYVDGKRRNRKKMSMLLRSLSRNVATSASNRKILLDITPDDEVPEGGYESDAVRGGKNASGTLLGIDSLRSYLDALEEISVIEDMPAWMPKLRSETIIRTSDTRYMTDPSIAAYFLGASAKDLLMDPETFGLLFENLVVRDLRIYAQSIKGHVFHYRDKTGLEVDAIIHLQDGRWGAIEIKLNDHKVNDGVKSLLRLKDKVDVEERNKLAFMAVVTGIGYAYTRPDGIHVIPVGCLKN